MAQVTVKINGYAYTVSCDDGQEPHLLSMARQVEQRIEGIKSIGGPSGEGRLLVLAALLMTDELHDMQIEVAALRAAAASGLGPAAKPDLKAARRLSRLAAKAEDIATTLDQA